MHYTYQLTDTVDRPSYMSYTRDPNPENTLLNAVKVPYAESEIIYRSHSTGSTDMGDFSCKMSTTNIGTSGIEGSGQSRYFKIKDPVKQNIVPA